MYIFLEGRDDNTFGCQNLKYFPILIVTLMGHFLHPQTQNYHHNSKGPFYISLLLDFIDNHLDDVIFQKEISMLLGYF